MIGPAARAVAVQYVHVVVALPGEGCGGFFRQLPDAFDRVDLGRDLGEHGGRIAGAGADFEDFFPTFEQQRLGHQRDDIRLRDGLPLGDRQGRILVGEFAQVLRQKGLARDLAHGLQYAGRSHAARGNVMLNHLIAEVGEVYLRLAFCERHN